MSHPKNSQSLPTVILLFTTLGNFILSRLYLAKVITTNIPVDSVMGWIGGNVVRYGGAEVQTASADSSRVQMINPLGLSAYDSPKFRRFSQRMTDIADECWL
jgi:hypothetical protein